MTKHRGALEPEFECFEVDLCDDLSGHEWVAHEHAKETPRGHLAALHQQSGSERLGTASVTKVHVDDEFFAWASESPVVLQVHGEEWRNMESLVKAPAQEMGISATATCGTCVECVNVALEPWRICDLGNDGDDAIGFIETIVKCDGIESNASA